MMPPGQGKLRDENVDDEVFLPFFMRVQRFGNLSCKHFNYGIVMH